MCVGAGTGGKKAAWTPVCGQRAPRAWAANKQGCNVLLLLCVVALKADEFSLNRAEKSQGTALLEREGNLEQK